MAPSLPSPSSWWTSALAVVALALLVTLSGGPRGCAANNIYGSGAINVQEVFASLTKLYRYDRDRVLITFQTSTIPQALAKYTAGELDFFISDVGLSAAQLSPFNGIQIPMMGTPLVVAFNLPGFGVGDNLVMDRETLARIWYEKGDIRQWDHEDIAQWNEEVTLPSLNISMTYWSPSTSALGYTAVFKTALSRFSPDFKTALATANNALEQMTPSLGPNKWAFAGDPFETGDKRINLTAATPGMMTYMERQKADAMGLPYIRLINRAGKTVDGSPAAVQAAMDQFSDLINNGTLVIDVVDSNGTDAWPMSYISYLTLSKTISPTTGGCSRASNMLLFLSWTQFNEAVADVFVENQFAPLTNPYRRRLINELYTITCQGTPVLTTPVLLGIGEEIDLMGDWTQEFQTESFAIKHFEATSAHAIEQMRLGDTDYAVSYTWSPTAVDVTPTSKRDVEDSDILGIPAVAYALVPAYFVSSLSSQPSLIMTIDVLASVFAGLVTQWNDTTIAALNPSVAAHLPNRAIRLVVGCDQTLTIESMLTQAFAGLANGAAAIAGYRAVACTSDPVAAISAADYSLGVWFSTQVITQVRNVKAASLVNPANTVVSANQTCILAAVMDFSADATALHLVNGPGRLSWPLVGYAVLTIYAQAPGDYSTAQGLLDWVYWTQTSTQASTVANNYNLAVPGQVPEVRHRTVTMLAMVQSTSTGAYVFSLQACVINGTICSDRGSCVGGECSCAAGWIGDHCQFAQSAAGSSSSDVLAPVLGSVLPAIALLVIAVVIIAVLLVTMRRRKIHDDWEIAYEELDVGDMLGRGGYGEVYKAKWKGSEVAVKVMGAGTISKDGRERFVNEARIMSHLRHPNVVLFMAASTKPPKMCIVMEYMALGSLYELLHNELIPEIPLVLKVKMIHQAAKGMHFLHSSGIAHRDLKSLNLLLDNKWNLKVSDFGLTSFKESLGKGRGGNDSATVEGSVPWMAPEVLEEANEVSHELADLYSYGIIMWEVLTRSQPYAGLAPAAIAVGVIRSDLRPKLPHDLVETEAGYVELMQACWSRDPTMRPSFDHIMSQLKTLIELSRGGSTHISGTTSSSSSSLPVVRRGPGQALMRDGSSVSGSSNASNEHRSGGGSSSGGRPDVVARHSVAPRRDVTFVVCDLARCNESWQSNPAGTAKAVTRYGRLVRKLVTPSEADEARHAKHAGGYVFSRSSLHSGGTYLVAFGSPLRAASFALELQQAVRDSKWPKDVPRLNSRVAVHHRPGPCRAPVDDLTRTGYEPAQYKEACELNLRCPPGRVACSPDFRAVVLALLDEQPSAQSPRHGRRTTPRKNTYQLNGAQFTFSWRGDDAYSLESGDDTASNHSGSHNGDDDDDNDGEVWDERLDQGMGLCSSNWCPWIIDRRKITTGVEVGRGNYGQVSEGTYDGRRVAVKQLYKGRLDDAAMVKMRKEAALLSDIDHPHVVKLIGLSITDGGSPMLVMELMPRGSLRDLLSNRSVKLTWSRRLRMLRDAALGIAHLHERGVLHRDIKSSNLLVDDDWSVKVGDFGFATAKQDNGTMTRCGTPCWTAPEIISDSLKHSEKADVYRFGLENLPFVFFLAHQFGAEKTNTHSHREQFLDRHVGSAHEGDALSQQEHDHGGDGRHQRRAAAGASRLPQDLR
ncbi:serine/threonine kinase [Acanthamoeba castellanii str. Neff]|uniref:non-specific serine/threonine protein kinase n=1 Tax=Acanthamoeba castellanii (strain ATCC 30010 / Neff) TaxID=1257118 RepID=L8GJM9_ACACF|nr:serine/threonine kinase [Acanthamoeba castellanii str. Neff]ELR13222.1 serine/threonine kinase [Acanthamoeba castellanii str. Neff]